MKNEGGQQYTITHLVLLKTNNLMRATKTVTTNRNTWKWHLW